MIIIVLCLGNVLGKGICGLFMGYWGVLELRLWGILEVDWRR